MWNIDVSGYVSSIVLCDVSGDVSVLSTLSILSYNLLGSISLARGTHNYTYPFRSIATPRYKGISNIP